MASEKYDRSDMWQAPPKQSKILEKYGNLISQNLRRLTEFDKTIEHYSIASYYKPLGFKWHQRQPRDGSLQFNGN